MQKLLAFLTILGLSLTLKPKTFSLSSSNPSAEHATNLQTDDNENLFEIALQDEATLEGKQLFIVLESTNPDFILSVLDQDKKSTKRSSVLIDVKTFSGNLAIAMSDTYFNGKLEFFRTSGKLRFKVGNQSTENLDYTVKVQIGNVMKAELGRTYTTRIDYMLNDFKVDLRYDGTKYPDLTKLRFQTTSVKQKEDYALSALLKHKTESYMLNTVFKKSVGGVLSEPKLPICKRSDCVYTLEIHVEKVNTLNIESFIVEKIERLSINHYEDYYDRVYDGNVTTTYELPYEESMEEMDVSITLVPVTGTSGLYVNPKTLPLELPKYAWKESGPLAKRITVKWEELIAMKADKSSLYISVNCDRPGEYLVKIDAHDPGFKGRLSSGIIEAGFVKDKEISNYLYFFEVFETQEISFDVTMNVFSGEADLFVKQCDSFADCKISESNLEDSEMLSVRNNHSVKTISHTFECKYRKRYQATTCEFVIGVRGSENHGTHYDISIQESKFHRLMIPGHSMNLNLNPKQERYLKFSYPKTSPQAKLFLSVEPIWGNFTLSLSKKEQFPTKEISSYSESFHTAKAGLYDAMKTIAITTELTGDFTIQGLYYIGISSLTSCALNLKFFERNTKDLTLHTLTAGNLSRGEVRSSTEIVYYTIKLSLDNEKASTVSINLVPLKGDYTMFANRDGKLPTRENYQIISDNHQIDLNYKDYNNADDEYIIGVQLNSKKEVSNESYQFQISFTYSNKPLLLNPGVLTTNTIKEANYFLVEVTKAMSNILVLKSIVDGYNISLCGNFASSERIEESANCQYSSIERSVSIYIEEGQITEACKENWEKGKCYLQLTIKGGIDQKFTLGYSYNDLPFYLVKDTVIHGPIITQANHMINFIYHAEPDSPVALYFNSKGRKQDIFTKIVKQDEFDDKIAVNFPNAASYDKDAQLRMGYVTNVFYSADVVSKHGYSPEILISIRGHKGEEGDKPYDPKHHFVMQSSFEGREILRTQTHVEHIYEEEWNYYTFYNNGIADSLRVYVSSELATRLEVNLSRNKKSRAPFTNKPLISKVGISSVELDIKSSDLKTDSTSNKDTLKGYFTVGVKSSNSAIVSVYWNNKVDLNYLELTPNEPSTMTINGMKKLYMTAYVKDADSKNKNDRGSVFFYFKTSVRADIYILKSPDSELNAPSANSYNWKSSIGKNGGVTMIKIDPDDPDYCIDCSYIGYVDSMENGQISMLVDVEHEKIPIFLLPGFNFPNYLPSQQEKVFRLYNPDSNSISFTVSMLSGFVNLYISDTPKVSSDNFKDFVALEAQLDTHKYITINPSKYGIKEAHDYYIFVSNPKLDASSFMLTVSKNLTKSPIEEGIQKMVVLSAGESLDFYYKPKKSENRFEVKLEIQQVYEEKHKDQVLELLPEYLDVYHITENNGKNKIQYSAKSVHYNRMVIEFDVTENTQGTFSVHVYNPVASAVTITLELNSNGYKLVNLNNSSVEAVYDDKSLIYEAYGLQDKYLFIDLRVCVGNVKVSVFQTDYDRVAANKSVEYKTIKDANSMIHYVKLEKHKAFIKVENEQSDLSVYELGVFNEVDLDKNPYSEVVQGNGGRVNVETDNNRVSFHPVELRVGFKEGFQHRVEYKLYLTDTYKIMKFLKNCDKHLLDKAFSDYDLVDFSKELRFETEANVKDADGLMRMGFDGLKNGTKYYGVVVARVELLPKENYYLTPVRSAKVYYDEFVIVTPKFNLPINLLVGVLVSFGMLASLFCLIKAYVFGDINKLHGMERLTNFEALDGGIAGPNLISILEQEYYDTTPEPTVKQEEVPDLDKPVEGEEVYDEESHGDIELTDNSDRTTPLA